MQLLTNSQPKFLVSTNIKRKFKKYISVKMQYYIENLVAILNYI